MIEVTYIEHSGFLLDTGDAYFLFDYYKGRIPEMDKNKPVTVFVSHKHHDHFNPVVFGLADIYQEILFIIAKGVPYKNLAIKFSKRFAENGYIGNILPVKKDISETVTLSNGKELIVTTLRSTDEGVAFLLDYNGKRYYHAGDLNLWVWDSADEEESKSMESRYLAEMEKIKGIDIDIAFLPLDPRLGNSAFRGPEIFLSNAHCRHFFPMHCWEEYGIIDRFLEKYPYYKDITVKIKPGNTIHRIN